MSRTDLINLSETPSRWDLSSIIPELAGCDTTDSLHENIAPLLMTLAEDAKAISTQVDALNQRGQTDPTALHAEEILEPIYAMQAIEKTAARYKTYFLLSRNEHFHDPAYLALYEDVSTALSQIKAAGNEGLSAFALPEEAIRQAAQENPEIASFTHLLSPQIQTPSAAPATDTPIDSRNVKVSRLFQQVNASRELLADPDAHTEALTLLVNGKLYQEWRKAHAEGKTPVKLASSRNGLPDGFITEMIDALPLLIDQASYAKAAQDEKDRLNFSGKIAAVPQAPQFT